MVKHRCEMVTAAQQEARRERRLAALVARQIMSPLAPAPDHFRVATWNVNSLRARAPALARFLERVRPDVMCLQETKASAPAPDAASLLEREGYNLAFVGEGAYNGVAIASLHPISDEQASGGFGDQHLDREPRLITCVTGSSTPVRVVSVYVPHGREVGHWHYEYKVAFLDQLARRVRDWVTDGHLIVAGDVNVAATDSDIFHPDAFVGLTHVTPRERRAWAQVLDAGLVDVDAAYWGPHERRFTWWNHGLNYTRNLGMRIDVVAADHDLARRVRATWIDHIERSAERPSDHAALVVDFDLE
jgi:exodeoxyribonuclease-3